MGIDVLIVVLLLLLAAFFGAACFAKSQIRSYAKRWGKREAGVEVEVGTISWSNYGRKLELAGLTLFNPAGYATEYAMQIEKLVLDLDLASFARSLGKAIDVNDLVLTSVDCNLEQKGGDSNLQDILATLDRRDEEPSAAGLPLPDPPHPSYAILSSNPYAQGGVQQHGVSWAPKCDCCQLHIALRVRAAEATRISGFAARGEKSEGGGFAVDDLIVDDFQKTYGEAVKSNGDIGRVLLRLLLVAALRSGPFSGLRSLTDRRCCVPWAAAASA